MELGLVAMVLSLVGVGLAFWRAQEMRPESRGRLRAVGVLIVVAMAVLWYLLLGGSV
jgi:glucose uptake protein GlcU